MKYNQYHANTLSFSQLWSNILLCPEIVNFQVSRTAAQEQDQTLEDQTLNAKV